MIVPEQVVALGGVVVSQVADSVPVEAVAYGGEIIDWLTVVKLVRQELVQAEDLMMEVLGLEQLSRAHVGFGRDRAIGFPAWPIIHDPGNAKHALVLVQELHAVEKRAKSKPGHAKDHLMELALRLDETAPHFLPTFWEEGARIFLRAGNIKMAAQLFSRAREAERTHSIPVDEKRHAAAFLEFALAGALSGKELTAESTAIAQRVNPKDALEFFQQLLVEQMRAGVPPYVRALKDLGSLAKAANMDEFAVKSSFLTVLLNSRAALRASEGFYKTAVATLKKMVAQDPTVFETLLTTFPDFCEYGIWSIPSDRISPWISILNKVGFTDKLIQETSPEVAAAWVNDACDRAQRTYFSFRPGKLSFLLRSVVLQMKQLAGQTVTVKDGISAPILDALLYAGMVSEFDREEQIVWQPWTIDLEQWEHSAATFDMPSLAQYLSQEPALVKRVSVSKHAKRFLEYPGTAEILRIFVIPQLQGTGGSDVNNSSLGGLIWRLGPLMESPEFRAHFAPELAEFTQRTTGESVLAATLRQGLLTEFEWPAMQQAIDELTAETYSYDLNAPDGEDRDEVRFHPSWPAIGVSLGGRGRVIFIEGEERVADESFDLPSKELSYSGGPDFIMAMGQVACSYYWDGHRFMWAEAPGVEWKKESRLLMGTWTFEVPGGRLVGGGIMRPGEGESGSGGNFLTDGIDFWKIDWLPSKIGKSIREIDSETGREGRHSVPTALAEILEPYAHKGWEFYQRDLYWLPVPDTSKDSPLISRDGIYAWIPLRDAEGNRIFLFADGEEVIGWQGLRGAVNRPGGGRWYLLNGRPDFELNAVDENLDLLFDASTRDAKYHWIHSLPVSAYAYLSVRDEAASLRLRTLTADLVSELYNTVASVAPLQRYHSHQDKFEHKKALAASITHSALEAAEALVGTKDPALCDAIVTLAAHVKGKMELFEEMKSPSSENPGSDGESFSGPEPSHEVLAGLPFRRQQWYEGPFRTAVVLSAIASVLHDGVAEAKGSPDSDVILLAIAHPEVLIALSVVPGQRIVDARGALAMARVVMDTGLYTDKAQAFKFELEESGHASKVYREEFADRNVVATWPGDSYIWNGERIEQWRGIAPHGVIPREISGNPVTGIWSSSGHSVDVLREALGAAESLLDSMSEDGVVVRDQSSEAAARFAQRTGWNESTARYFLAGLPTHEDSLAALGLTRDELDCVHARIAVAEGSLLADMMIAATADPIAAVKEGLDGEAAVEVWLKSGITNVLSDDDLRRVEERADKPAYASSDPLSWELRLLGMRLRGEVLEDFDDLVTLSGIYVTLAQQPSLDQAAREWMAQELDWLAATARTTKCTFSDYENIVAAMLGLGKTEVVVPHTDGAWTLNANSSWEGNVEFDPTLVQDWDAEFKRLSQIPQLVGIFFLQRSGPNEYAKWLRAPVEGAPADPLISAPKVVADVVQRLDISEDAARYYVQLLALQDPTDANVQSWNGWSKKERVAAAQPLLERGLIVEAKRARARRSYFLPGGWREASVPHLPLETWKASTFGLEETLKVKPTQFPLVLPLRPYPQLFADAWKRVITGDAPEFGEL